MGLIMSLKKYLESLIVEKSGQSFVEYFVLLTVIAALTLIATSSLFSRSKTSVEHFVSSAAGAMGVGVTPMPAGGAVAGEGTETSGSSGSSGSSGWSGPMPI